MSESLDEGCKEGDICSIILDCDTARILIEAVEFSSLKHPRKKKLAALAKRLIHDLPYSNRVPGGLDKEIKKLKS